MLVYSRTHWCDNHVPKFELNILSAEFYSIDYMSRLIKDDIKVRLALRL